MEIPRQTTPRDPSAPARPARAALLGVTALAMALAGATPSSATKLYYDGGYHRSRAGTDGSGGTGGAGAPDPTKVDQSDLVDPVYSTDSHGCMSGTVGVPMSFPLKIEVDAGSHFSFAYDYYEGGGVREIPGLTMSDSGVLSGTPTEASAGTFEFSVYNGVSSAFEAQQCFQIGNPKGSAASPGGLTFDDPFDTDTEPGRFVDAAPPPLHGQVGRVAWTISSLPPGMSFAEGEVYGAVAQEGVWTYTLTATDSTGATATSKAVTITSKAPEGEPALLTDGTCIALNKADPVDWFGYRWHDKPSQQVTYDAPYPPDGLTVDPATGRITGTPVQDDVNPNSNAVEVEARWKAADGSNRSAGVWICANRDEPLYPPTFLEDIKPGTFATGEAISMPAPGSYGGDGNGIVSWDVSPTPLPGLTFSNGVMSGKLRYPANYTYQVQATDDRGWVASTFGTITVYDANTTMSYDGTCLGGTADAPAQSGQDLAYFPWLVHNPLGGTTSWEITDVSNDLTSGNFGVDERKWLSLDPTSGLVRMTVPTAASDDGLGASEGTYSGTMTMATTITDATGTHKFTNPFCFHLKVNNKFSGGGGIRG